MGNKNSGIKHFDIPFDLESEESLYWLGYLCADATIMCRPDLRLHRVSIVSIDEDIIVKFRTFIGSRAKYHKRKQGGYSEVIVNSRQLVHYLIGLGITPKKSKTLNPQIPLSSSFLRGYFDGDGSIKKKHVECKMVTSSELFKNKIEEHLSELGIYFKTRKYKDSFYICLERASHVRTFLDYIYKDASIFMNRKYKQYVALFSNE